MSDARESDDREPDAELLRAIAHGTRLQILSVLQGAERAVGEIEALTGIAQPGLSQQLGVLRKAELVGTRREGKQVFYSLVAERLTEARALIDELLPASSVSQTPAPTEPNDPVQRRGGAAVFARITG
ncbi:ArsR/SmtB family transcription factor [Croceicoccus bisphenolivorans]|uniref:ArsR/SmtB family transcription factor n=1 Tax=Croceicoccus bisphenolivorans TaxID=1783232 RepID=UPI00083312ED|nr:metalloregulator ArsR/SmtB family transcription factor [Croceicoccus bisphenolivorans]